MLVPQTVFWLRAAASVLLHAAGSVLEAGHSKEILQLQIFMDPDSKMDSHMIEDYSKQCIHTDC